MDHLVWLKRGTQGARDATRRALRNSADDLNLRPELEEAMAEARLSRRKGLFGIRGREDV